MELKLADEKERNGGWEFSFALLEQIKDECENLGYGMCLEEVEAVLSILRKHGILVPNVRVEGLDAAGGQSRAEGANSNEMLERGGNHGERS